MDEATLGLIITSFSVFAVFIGLFIWGLVTGQFKKVEEPKYNIFEPEDFEDEERKDDKNA